MPSKPELSRILLKLSGEVLANEDGFGIDSEKVSYLAKQIKPVYEKNVNIGLIIGAGNIFRGMQAAAGGMDRVTGDYLGMLATIMNAIALQDSLEKIGCQTRTLSAINVTQIAEPYIRRRAIRHMEKGRIVLFAAGTGNPFMTTDTGSALRALEISADALLMAKNEVDGIYDTDPNKNSEANKFEQITYLDAISKRLKVMDSTALSLCMEHEIPVIVFDLFTKGNLFKIVNGDQIGTLVHS